MEEPVTFPGAEDIISNCTFALVLFVGVYFVQVFCKFSFKYYQAKNSGVKGVPSVPTWFPFGGAWMLVRYRRFNEGFNKAEEWYGDKKNGLFSLQLLTTTFLIPTHHEWLKLLINSAWHHANPGKLMENHAMSVFEYWLGTNVTGFVDSGRHDEWQFLRRLLGRPFISTNVNKLQTHMVAINSSCINYVRNEARRRGPNVPLDMKAVARALAFDTLGRTSFSRDFKAFSSLEEGRQAKLMVVIDELTLEADRRSDQWITVAPWLHMSYVWLPLPQNIRFRENKTFFRNEIQSIVQERRQAIQRDPSAHFSDLLQMCLDARDPETGSALSEAQLLDSLAGILFAGVDTTSLALSFALYALASHSDVQTKMREEVNLVLPNRCDPDENTFVELKYTRCVLKEVMRLYSPVSMVMRTTEKEVSMNGITVPKGTPFLTLPGVVMRHPYNFERPLEFLPERFEHDSPPFQWMPFMHGRRTCIGQRYAEVQMTLALAALVQNFEFSVPADYTFELTMSNIFTHTKEDLRLLVHPL